MAEPFIGEIKMFGFNWAPRGWAKCDGQIMNVSGNEALYSIIGNRFGGSPPVNFALPDLRGRTPVHPDPNSGILDAHAGGYESVSLTVQNMPSHNHGVTASNSDADTNIPVNNYLAVSKPGPRIASASVYKDVEPEVSMAEGAVANTGAGTPHNNMQPYLTVNFCIALVGEYPQRS